MVEIVPSILAADFARLGAEIASVERGGASMLHLDVMDGHFVPNLTIGPPVVESVRRITGLKLDVHLMISDPDRYAPVFIQAGANSVSVHQEACHHLNGTLRMIRSQGALAGVVLNPSTPVSSLEDVLELADYVLVMSVNPGFGGQVFIPRTLEKIRRLAHLRQTLRLAYRIEVDGGIDRENVAEVVRAGCDWIVTGTAVFHTPDPGQAVSELRRIAVGATMVSC